MGIITTGGSGIKVIVKKVGGPIVPASTTLPPTLTVNNPGVTSLKELSDVSANNAANGDVLVYDANTNKYIPETINIDGGGF